MSEDNILEIEDLKVSMMTINGIIFAVRGVTLQVKRGEVHGIVGESGCGKSMMVKSVMRLHNEKNTEYGGEIFVNGKEVLGMKKSELDAMRGSEVAMIFQNPMTSLNPIMKAGEQISEMLRKKMGLKRPEAKAKVLEMFERVGITPAEQRYDQYPYEMSGGLLQRVMIAMAMITNPKLLIADEPTTALDVTIQAQIIELMKEVKKNSDVSIIFITHDLGVIAEICDSISVMYAGKVVENGSVLDIFDHPGHPYTKALLESNPRGEDASEKLQTIDGTPPSLYNDITGCSFAPRCPYATEKCRTESPQKKSLNEGHYAVCHMAEQMYKESMKGA